MKYILAHLLLALSGWMVTAATQQSVRDPGGFLPVPSSPTESPALVTPAASAAPVANSNSISASTESSYVLDDKYKLMPGDSISFLIKEDRTNAPLPLTVTESSDLEIPYIGRLNVSGRTCKQLAEEVKVMLEKDYYHRATVIIGVNQRTKVLGNVYIIGPVRQPGQLPIPAGEIFTAGKAIVRAGGFMDFADKKNVKVVRSTGTGSTTFKINMVNVLEKGMTEQDLPLEPEDFIIVPTSPFNF